jgi:hypothetical protein
VLTDTAMPSASKLAGHSQGEYMLSEAMSKTRDALLRL